MSGVVLAGAISGAITVNPPAVAGTNTITLPAETGTALTSSSVISATQVDTDILRVYAATANNTPAINTVTKVKLDVVSYDTANAWDNVNLRFNPKKPGYYSVYAVVNIVMTGTAGFTIGAFLYKNGATVSRTLQLINYTSAFNQFLHCNDIIPMNGSSDYLEFQYSTNSGTATYSLGSTLTYMTTQYIRKL